MIRCYPPFLTSYLCPILSCHPLPLRLAGFSVGVSTASATPATQMPPATLLYLRWPLLLNPNLPLYAQCGTNAQHDIIRDRWTTIEQRIRTKLRNANGDSLLTPTEWNEFRIAARNAHLPAFASMYPVGGTIKCCGPPDGNGCVAPRGPIETFIHPGPFKKLINAGGMHGRYSLLSVLQLDHQPGLATHTLPIWRHALQQLGEQRFAGPGPSWAAGLDAQRLMHLCFSAAPNAECDWPAVLTFRCGSEYHGEEIDAHGRRVMLRLHPCHPTMDAQKKRDGIRYMPAASSL